MDQVSVQPPVENSQPVSPTPEATQTPPSQKSSQKIILIAIFSAIVITTVFYVYLLQKTGKQEDIAQKLNKPANNQIANSSLSKKIKPSVTALSNDPISQDLQNIDVYFNKLDSDLNDIDSGLNDKALDLTE